MGLGLGLGAAERDLAVVLAACDVGGEQRVDPGDHGAAVLLVLVKVVLHVLRES